MISTLHKYLARDLVKSALMATAAFTLIMTTFAVIEPMRKEGIGGAQVLNLFWYLLPVMLSLTMPIAAVFSATFTYGRFAMDNEMTACRAGGISVLTLLKPAIVMGIIVGVVSLALSNWIAPELARRGARTVKKNLQGLVYQKLRTSNYLDFRDFDGGGSWKLHADGADPANNQLRGVVVVKGDRTGDASYYTASLAYVEFAENEGVTELTVVAINPTSGEQKGRRMYEMGRFTFGPYPLATPFEEKASFYDWSQLNAILANPRESSKVESRLRNIRRRLQASYLCDDIAEAINNDRPYKLVDDEGFRYYTFRAPAAVVSKNTRLILTGGGPDGDSDLPVIVEVGKTSDSIFRRIYCRQAEISMTRMRDESKVKVTLGDVAIHELDLDDAEPTRRPRYHLGMLEMPAKIKSRQSDVTLEEIYNHPERHPAVLTQSNNLRQYIRNRLQPRIVAEIHGRLAYGFGCILLAPIGAALGLIYRGGHILSAFALCCVPAMLLVVMIVMGKQMIANPDVSALYGKAAIWSGVAVLATLETYLYGVVLRH